MAAGGRLERAWAVLLATLAVVLFSRVAAAHGTRTVSVEVVEASAGQALIHVRQLQPGDAVRASLGAPCTTAPLDDDDARPALASSLTVRAACPGSVAGATLTIEGLGPLVNEAIVLYAFADGRTGSAVVRASEPTLVLPEAESVWTVAASYVGLGIAHIATGYDHLLFLLLLVLQLRRVRPVILAETAFTLSHSLSFGATALGLVRVSPAAAEACIALSLVLMALDIRPDRPAPALRGASLALVFGLVHGLGFAGALREVGLPDHDVAVALLGFAGGVELGQIAFLAGALVLLGAIARARPLRGLLRLEPALVVGLGGVSTYWLIQRFVVCLNATVHG